MKRVLVSWIVLLITATMSHAAIEGRFMQYPDIRGDRIVFTFEGDLWTVPASGGLAMRLTSHPGNEFSAKFSPDGQWIAFSANYQRGPNVYLMPIDGGTPKRLTYRGQAQVVTWTPDSKKIVYRASFENTFRPIVKLFAVSIDGTYPERLPVPRGILCSFSADGSKMVYNPRGREEYYWKRYKGGQYPDIWLYDFRSKEFRKLTNYVGKNAYPMWIGEAMYYVSDQGENGIANIYRYDFASGQITQVTNYTDVDVQMPSTDGRSIVYLHAGYLHVLDLASGQSRRVEVQIPTDGWQLAERTINPKDYIHSMSISADGKTAVFEARGDVFTVPAEEGQQARNLTNSPSTRERYPQLSPDGKWLAFFSDRSGEYELYLLDMQNEGPWRQLTDGLRTTVYHLEWSPDGSKILFGTKDFCIYYVDVKTGQLTKVACSNQLKNDEFYWEISDYCWSPDSKWIAYSFVQYNRNSKIFLYSLEQKSSYPVTDEFYDCLNPSFDPEGEYLYFLSYRNFDARMDVFEDNHVIPNPVKVMLVQLKAGQKPPFEKGSEAEQKSPAPFRIDIEGIGERIFSVPVEAGNYFYLKAGKGYLTWVASQGFGEDEYDQILTPKGDARWLLHIFDVAAGKEVVIDKKISDWRLSVQGEHMLVRKGNEYFVTTPGKAYSAKDLGQKLNLEQMSYRVQPRKEWEQIFSDTWRWYRDFFYDPGMHGRDWQKMGEFYRSYVPQLRSREDLNWLLSQMVGELCVSHTYISGGDRGPLLPPEDPTFPGLLGAELEPSTSGYYRFARIFGPTDYDRDLKGPLVRPDIDLKEGDYLIAINGREVRVPENPYQYLQMTAGQKVKVTVNRRPSAVGAATYEVEPVRSENSLRYNRWLADNIKKVLAASNGELGYMHITAMGSGNTAQFDKFWRAFRYKKGLIIDVRGNGGGWTEYFLIDKLERKMVAYNCLKEMVPFRYPGSASNAHLVVLTNEYNGSDGEAFVEHFKARKLGTVIGTPSWGGLVGIVNGQTTIDNGLVHQSNNAFYGREGTWWVENHGADPDILVENDPASEMAGHDKQLETAIAFLLEKIKTEPFVFPEKPAYPKK
ncbi:MAG: S41 family peptidase [bacterium]|nr:S41 family peptidase [candidate division KSB1 bacterium]MDH7560489.1 S41 family peptidase [bacterium]